MLFDFFVAARHNLVIVYGTMGMAIMVNINIGNSALFSSDAAIVAYHTQQPWTKLLELQGLNLVTSHNHKNIIIFHQKINNYEIMQRNTIIRILKKKTKKENHATFTVSKRQKGFVCILDSFSLSH